AEDGIRDKLVTGVQTCALPIFGRPTRQAFLAARPAPPRLQAQAGVPAALPCPFRDATLRSIRARCSPRQGEARGLCAPAPRRSQIGRASCRERVGISEMAGSVE